MTFKPESYKKGIALSTLYNVFNKGLVFCLSVLIAYFFGTQLKVDIYFYAYNTIVIFSTFMTSLNASILIPESMRLRSMEKEKEATIFLNFFLIVYFFIAFLICCLLIVDPTDFFSMISGFSKEALKDQKQIILLSIPLLFLIPVTNFLADILTSYRFFTIPMIVGIINNLISILFLVFLHNSLDVLSLLIGLLISNALNFILLILLMKRKLNWQFRFQNPRMGKRIWKNIVFAQAGNITSSVCSYAPLYLLSGLQTGIITSLTFAQQIASLPTHLITNQFSSVVGIKFNELYSKKEFATLNQIFISTSSFLFFILIPVSGIFFLFPDQITSILLERGSFNKASVTYTASFLKWLGLLLPLIGINTLFARLFMASHKIKEPFWYQILFNVSLILVLYITVPRFGFVAYPVTLVSIHLLNVLFCYFLERYYFNMIAYKLVLKKLFIVILLNIVIATLVYGLMHKIKIHSTILTVVLGTGLYLMLFTIVGFKFNLDGTFNSFIGRFLERKANYGRIKNK